MRSFRVQLLHCSLTVFHSNSVPFIKQQFAKSADMEKPPPLDTLDMDALFPRCRANTTHSAKSAEGRLVAQASTPERVSIETPMEHSSPYGTFYLHHKEAETKTVQAAAERPRHISVSRTRSDTAGTVELDVEVEEKPNTKQTLKDLKSSVYASDCARTKSIVLHMNEQNGEVHNCTHLLRAVRNHLRAHTTCRPMSLRQVVKTATKAVKQQKTQTPQTERPPPLPTLTKAQTASTHLQLRVHSRCVHKAAIGC